VVLLSFIAEKKPVCHDVGHRDISPLSKGRMTENHACGRCAPLMNIGAQKRKRNRKRMICFLPFTLQAILE
jgi:hypothetical protein